ncbi:MLO-like protein 1 isoform X2 [Juglans regia]|uniref:MLO-like protein 1 isoform X2 n=1 Tax=Juglans regia TaxID=51240 RepID=A0A6P9EJE3_JUGRE|nr:MLO-like protein 1 isoform X2 [Juglans regia]
MAGGGEGTTLEYTPTWVVAVVCSVIVLISLVVERTLHSVGKYLKKNNQMLLFEALQKIKEELMLLGFISLLLTVFQDRIAKICISEVLANKWLPCKKEKDNDAGDSSSSSSTAHFQTFFKYPSFVLPAGTARHLLAEASASTESCAKGKVPMLSLKALHHLHIFIFVLAVVHVIFCALTILFGGAKSLLAVGTKLEHVICQLAQEVAEKHVAVEGELVVKPSDDHFWFHRPKIVLLLIHIIMFQNAFELAFFFWTWVQYDFDSCIMGQIGFVIPRLVIGAFIQFVCSYSTLPLYAIVTLMGSSLKKGIFTEHVQEGLVDWAKHAKKTTGSRKAANGTRLYGSTTTHGSSHVVGRQTTGLAVELTEAGETETAMEEGNAGEIEHANVSREHK